MIAKSSDMNILLNIFQQVSECNKKSIECAVNCASKQQYNKSVNPTVNDRGSNQCYFSIIDILL